MVNLRRKGDLAIKMSQLPTLCMKYVDLNYTLGGLNG